MKRTDALYQSFVEILREELVPAMGCTEPIAIAYAAAQARAVLGKRPERVRIEVSGNIIKNVKSVVVPHTGSMHGIAAAGDQASARIVGSHTNLVQLLHGTKRLIDRPCSETVSERRTDRSVLTVERIVDFAQSLCPEDVQEIFADVCAHRVLLSQQAKTQQSTAQDVMQALLREVALPDAAF